MCSSMESDISCDGDICSYYESCGDIYGGGCDGQNGGDHKGAIGLTICCDDGYIGGVFVVMYC
jgi:hypothetical protein